MRIKIRLSDKLFSQYIRTKKGKCEYCSRDGRMWKLEASHYISRSHEAVRFDEENVRVLCFLCHKNLGGYQRSEQGEYDLWMKELLGEIKYRQLVLRGHNYQKKDEKLAMIFVTQLIAKTANKQTVC